MNDVNFETALNDIMSGSKTLFHINHARTAKPTLNCLSWSAMYHNRIIQRRPTTYPLLPHSLYNWQPVKQPQCYFAGDQLNIVCCLIENMGAIDSYSANEITAVWARTDNGTKYWHCWYGTKYSLVVIMEYGSNKQVTVLNYSISF